jgi:SAM-dependent methyltransferase
MRDAIRSLAWTAEERSRRRRHRLVGPPGLWELKRNFQIGFLKQAGLQPGHCLADLGCGTLRGGIPLIRYLDTGKYFGIEVRRQALAEAAQELREEGLEWKRPALIQTDDMAALELPVRFDFAWAYSVLFHMSEPALEGCFRFLEHHLKPGAFFYSNVHIGDRTRGHWREFPVIWRSMNAYRDLAAGHGMSVEDIGSTGELGHVSGKASHDEQRMLRFART